MADPLSQMQDTATMEAPPDVAVQEALKARKHKKTSMQPSKLAAALGAEMLKNADSGIGCAAAPDCATTASPLHDTQPGAGYMPTTPSDPRAVALPAHPTTGLQKGAHDKRADVNAQVNAQYGPAALAGVKTAPVTSKTTSTNGWGNSKSMNVSGAPLAKMAKLYPDLCKLSADAVNEMLAKIQSTAHDVGRSLDPAMSTAGDSIKDVLARLQAAAVTPTGTGAITGGLGGAAAGGLGGAALGGLSGMFGKKEDDESRIGHILRGIGGGALSGAGIGGVGGAALGGAAGAGALDGLKLAALQYPALAGLTKTSMGMPPAPTAGMSPGAGGLGGAPAGLPGAKPGLGAPGGMKLPGLGAPGGMPKMPGAPQTPGMPGAQGPLVAKPGQMNLR
jgi:hypothetical protein